MTSSRPRARSTLHRLDAPLARCVPLHSYILLAPTPVNAMLGLLGGTWSLALLPFKVGPQYSVMLLGRRQTKQDYSDHE